MPRARSDARKPGALRARRHRAPVAVDRGQAPRLRARAMGTTSESRAARVFPTPPRTCCSLVKAVIASVGEVIGYELIDEPPTERTVGDCMSGLLRFGAGVWPAHRVSSGFRAEAFSHLFSRECVARALTHTHTPHPRTPRALLRSLGASPHPRSRCIRPSASRTQCASTSSRRLSNATSKTRTASSSVHATTRRRRSTRASARRKRPGEEPISTSRKPQRGDKPRRSRVRSASVSSGACVRHKYALPPRCWHEPRRGPADVSKKG